MNAHRHRVLLVSKFDTRFHRDIVHGVLAYAHQQTRWRLTCETVIKGADPQRLRPDGVISLEGNREIDLMAHQPSFPFVFAGNPMRNVEASAVSCDEQALGAMAADYLVGLGLRNFAYVGHGPWPFVRQRLEGFARALAARNLGPVHQMIGVLYDRRRRFRFERDMLAMLQRLPRPCGILAANDALGVEVVAACQSIGLRVPEEAAVLGVDDDEIACELSEIPLSSVAQPLFAIGYEAARLLHEHMERPGLKAREVLMPPLRVVARASSDLIALDDADVVAALGLIKNHFAEGINVEWLVQQLPVARRSLERRFRSLVGRTMLDQIHLARFQKAKELLAETDLGVKVVAQRSGFVNARWMADSFRRELGTTPNRYRRQFRSVT